MKWYFASRMRHKNKISEINEFLKGKNQEIAFEWSSLDSLKPYSENSEKASLIAENISLSLKKTDVFVLISDKEGTDMFIELGIIIGDWLENSRSRIYVVGKFNNRSLMHFHPSIKRVDSLIDVFFAEQVFLSEKDKLFLNTFCFD